MFLFLFFVFTLDNERSTGVGDTQIVLSVARINPGVGESHIPVQKKKEKKIKNELQFQFIMNEFNSTAEGQGTDLMWRLPMSATVYRPPVSSSPSRIHFTSGFGEPKTLHVNSIDCPLTVAKSVGVSSMSGASACCHFYFYFQIFRFYGISNTFFQNSWPFFWGEGLLSSFSSSEISFQN